MTVGNSQAADSSWAKKYFSHEGTQKILAAVKAAERKTRGDIVPMVVHRSANLSNVSPTLFLLFFVLVLLIGTKPIIEEYEISFFLFSFCSALVSLTLSLLLARWEFIQRLVIPGSLLNHEVHTRAELEFYRNHFDQTKSHGAVLIFVSLLERRVVVLCDEFLAKKIPQERWDSVSELISTHMKQNELVNGMIQAIEKTGQFLAEVLPGDGTQLNEISTDFCIKE